MVNSDWLIKYGELLAAYCLELQPNDRVLVKTTTLAEPLVKTFYKSALERGAHVEVEMTFEDEEELYVKHANDNHLKYISPLYDFAIRNFEAYLVIRAPYKLEQETLEGERWKLRQETIGELQQLYSKRTANLSLKRSLCQYPTIATAHAAGMTLEEYTKFIIQACFLDNPKPQDEWLKIRKNQQYIVDYLNQSDEIRYQNPNFDIKFNVKDRIWINSDGKTNMPSGEVFTGPIEESVQGEIYFNYPSIYMGKEVRGVRLKVNEGQVVEWSAEVGQDVLDKVFSVPGARFFGEVAIGTNYNIQIPTKNILFDEKIGGTIHMAVGQSYLQTGGKNQSTIHWDLITDMKHGGKIWADGKKIYENGLFIIQ